MYENKVIIFVFADNRGKRQVNDSRMHDFAPQSTNLTFPQLEVPLITCLVSPASQDHL